MKDTALKTDNTIKSRTIALAGIFAWVLFLFVFIFTDSILFKCLLSLPLLCILPGLLFALNINFQDRLDWFYLFFSVGASLVILMMYGLVINFVLPFLSITPLVTQTLIWSVSILFIILAFFPVFNNRDLVIAKCNLQKLDWLMIFPALAFVVMAVLGAFRLNNEHSGAITMYMLLAMAFFLVLLLIFGSRVKEVTNAVIIYFLSSALLLMTSLRGWDIVGHDIQREFNVFQLTKNSGVWSYENLRDAYDACMSISILPTIFSEISAIPDIYVYKIIFQLIFALVPVACFILFSKYFSRFVSLLSVIVLISFPTFFSDMPMLNRQEIAFLLFVLIIFLMLDSTIGKNIKYFLITFFGVGIVLSHYSTTYIVILFLLSCWFGFWFFKLFSKIEKIRIFFSQSKFFSQNYILADKPAIPFLILIILIVSSFTWSSVFTQTSDSSIKRVLHRTLESLTKDSENPKSNDTLYSLFTTAKISDEETLQLYKQEVVDVIRHEDTKGLYYSGDDFENYVPSLATAKNLPITSLGSKIESLGLSVEELNKNLKFGTAKILQLFLFVGLFLSLFGYSKKFFINKPKVELFLLSSAGVVLLAAMVVVPVLSVEYGVLRAFQQSLLVTAPFIVMGCMLIFGIFGKRASYALSACFVILFFLTSTGVITQITGGYKPLLHMNNSGPYYDFYYIHDSEKSALKWINNEASMSLLQTEIQTDVYVSNKVNGRSSSYPVNEIYPSLTRKNAFVFLGYSNVNNGYSIISHGGKLMNITYPSGLIDIYKNKVYDSEGVIIYR